MTIYNFNMLYVQSKSMFIWIFTCTDYRYPCVWAMTLSNSTSQVRVINAVPVSDSWSVVSRQFLWAFQLGRHRYCCCKYIPWLFSNSAYACVPQKYSICLVLCPLIWIVCIVYLYIEAHNYGIFLRINIPGSCVHLGGSIGVDGTRALFAYATRCPDS